MLAGARRCSRRLEPAELPTAMQTDIERWRAAYPQFVAFAERLYTEQRGHARG